jgi:hypothetical protein
MGSVHAPGISKETVGSEVLYLGVVSLPPGGRHQTSGVSLERLLKPTHRAPRFGRTNSSNTLSQPGAFSRLCGKIPVSRQTMGLNCVPFGGLTSDAELERSPAGVTSMAPRFSYSWWMIPRSFMSQLKPT